MDSDSTDADEASAPSSREIPATSAAAPRVLVKRETSAPLVSFSPESFLNLTSSSPPLIYLSEESDHQSGPPQANSVLHVESASQGSTPSASSLPSNNVEARTPHPAVIDTEAIMSKEGGRVERAKEGKVYSRSSDLFQVSEGEPGEISHSQSYLAKDKVVRTRKNRKNSPKPRSPRAGYDGDSRGQRHSSSPSPAKTRHSSSPSPAKRLDDKGDKLSSSPSCPRGSRNRSAFFDAALIRNIEQQLADHRSSFDKKTGGKKRDDDFRPRARTRSSSQERHSSHRRDRTRQGPRSPQKDQAGSISPSSRRKSQENSKSSRRRDVKEKTRRKSPSRDRFRSRSPRVREKSSRSKNHDGKSRGKRHSSSPSSAIKRLDHREGKASAPRPRRSRSRSPPRHKTRAAVRESASTSQTYLKSRVLQGRSYTDKMARPYNGAKTVHLFQRITDSMEPVVGLSYVSEWIACSRSMDPYYECDLCQVHGKVEVMMSHILGKLHRDNFLDRKERNFSREKYLSKRKLMKLLEKYDDRFSEETPIQTIYSDEQYPWPSTKSPWDVEMGGTGNSPTLAQENLRSRRENYNKTDVQVTQEKMQMEHLAELQRSSAPVAENVKPDMVKVVKSKEQMSHYLSVLKSLLEKSTKFHLSSCLGREDRSDLERMRHKAIQGLNIMGKADIISENWLPEKMEENVRITPVVDVKQNVGNDSI